MRSRMVIDIDAPPQLVFAVASDPTRWPALLPHYQRVDVLRRWPPEASGGLEITARYVAVRPLFSLAGLGIPVAWTSRFRADPVALELHFRHVGGATAGMVVTWRIRAHDGGTRVTLDHAFGRSTPGAGLRGGDGYTRLIERWFVRPIAGRTLATLRAICEALPPRWGLPAVPVPAAAPQPQNGDRAGDQVHAR